MWFHGTGNEITQANTIISGGMLVCDISVIQGGS